MLRLIIGGNSQGKLDYALKVTGLSEKQVFNGKTLSWRQFGGEHIIYGLEQIIEDFLIQGIDPLLWVKELVEKQQFLIVICDEVGCGVIPIQEKQREYREIVGKVCCLLAQQAQLVERIYCGMATVIKEG